MAIVEVVIDFDIDLLVIRERIGRLLCSEAGAA